MKKLVTNNPLANCEEFFIPTVKTKWQGIVTISSRATRKPNDADINFKKLAPIDIESPKGWKVYPGKWGKWHVSQYKKNSGSLVVNWRRRIQKEE
jgi:hypothetical protein